MKRIYLIKVAVLLSLFGFTACMDDALPGGEDVTDGTKGEIIENMPERVRADINSIFAMFNINMPNKSVLREMHSDFGYPSIMLITDTSGYDVVSEDTGYNWFRNDLAYRSRAYTSDSSFIIWADMYRIIYQANNVISLINEDTENTELKFYLAQGYAMRAFSYLVLAQLYQFNYVGHQNDLCVPIVTVDNMHLVGAQGAPRSTVEEVYTLIKTDIDKAIDLLNLSESSGVIRTDKRYVNAAVAYGFRARMNLAMQNWSAAASDADMAITKSGAAPASITDVKKPYFSDSTNEGDWMWGVIVAETDDTVLTGIVNWISHTGSLNNGYANVSGGRQINKVLYNSIPNTDVRKGWWLNASKVSPNLNATQKAYMNQYKYPAYTQVKFAPYNNVVGTTTNANDIPLMRVEEMYLIKAEAQAMGGGGDGKATLENFIKTYRDPSYICPASSGTALQEEVFRQRRIELWGEGLNWFDIMRLNKGIDRRGGGFPNATTVFNILPGDPVLLWRIPQREITANLLLSESDNNPAVPTPQPVPDY